MATSHLLIAGELLRYVHGNTLSEDDRIERAIELAAHILLEAKKELRPEEKSRLQMMSKMMKDPVGKTFFSSMTDQCFRSGDATRTADQLIHLLDVFGIPSFLPKIKQLLFTFFKSFGHSIPNLLIPMMNHYLRKETAHLLIPAEKLSKHIEAKRKEGFTLNINHLGEAVLSEEEADHKLSLYLRDLKNPLIDAISVKISSIYSQIHLVAREDTLDALSIRYRKLLRVAMENGNKLVNLDMEAYHDLIVTAILFKRVLDEPEFKTLTAGIVLQAYLPDSFAMQKELTQWALKRTQEGGAPIRIRIVKGANMSMEHVESSLKNWELPTFHDKTETDANFKRMLFYALTPENTSAAQIGIASHNLFDLAFALILRTERELESVVFFEMLDGMADHISRVLLKISGNVKLYCGIVAKEEFPYAIAYYVRRLEENTGPDNFLKHSFDIFPGSESWRAQVYLFREAFKDIKVIGETPRRTQNRLTSPPTLEESSSFDNEPDTDFSLEPNVIWAQRIYETWSKKSFSESIPLVIGGKTITTQMQAEGLAPSNPSVPLYHYSLADETHIDLALNCAKEFAKTWANTSIEEKADLALKTVQLMRERRGDLIGSMIADGGKSFLEADVELCEAIDFIKYYRESLLSTFNKKEIIMQPKGTLLIAPPWNFPASIPCGGTIGGLLTGNCILFKPAPESVLTGWFLLQCFWDAGFPKEALQFLTCVDDPIGSSIIRDPRLDAVILTGATSTARKFLSARPDLDLTAECGGKNAMIITALSDRDVAIQSLIQSAFGHSGQKCSAVSLAILENEIYSDKNFLKKLKEATESLKVGSSFDPSSKITPLICYPNEALLRALTTLEPGESWLLEPKQDPENPWLWSPGIKLGVKKGSFTHQTELFGPVLGIMRAENLESAIHISNSTPYGLTAGLQSLDDREQKRWITEAIVGNYYINRTTTGAVVQRQPFGGCKNSCFGLGMKAGGPNTLLQFVHPKQIDLPKEQHPVNEMVNQLNSVINKFDLTTEEIGLWHASISNYAFWWQRFKEGRDNTKSIGQDNVLFYMPLKKMCFRVKKSDKPIDFLRVMAAALTCQTPLLLSFQQASDFPPKANWNLLLPLFNISHDTDEEFLERVRSGQIKRIKILSEPPPDLSHCCLKPCCFIDSSPILASGRFELLHYLRSVSLSHDYHRYGNLGLRENEIRKPVK